MTEYYIKDEGDLRQYYFQVPNMIDDLGLSIFAFRLYGHLKRVAGDEGICYQSTRTLANSCKMSTASVSRAKRELIYYGLINIDEHKTKHGGRDYHQITIINIWNRNNASYSRKQVSDSNLQVSPQKLASYPGAIKEEPIKNNPIKNNMEEEGENAGAIFRAYESEIGSITPMISEELQELEKEHPTEWIIAAMRVASINGKRSLGYFKAILKRWKVDGYGTELKAQKRANGKDPLAGIREFLEEIGDGEPN